jgi:quercetin dioxygenase-like cupin family protein
VIDNGWCRAGYEEVHCAIWTARLRKEKIVHDAQDASRGCLMDLAGTAASAGEQTGVIWTLRGSSDLNANLVSFEAGGGVGEHINDEVDVIFVGVSGTGSVLTNGEESSLSAGTLVLVRKGTRRSTLALSEGFTYLTVHLRRGPLHLGREAR